MVKITEELVRRRAEHNEGAIGSLEELSLHMLHIECIEHLDHWCRDLQILLLQNNVISKIENLNRLKKLEYLNLSLNIIEVIENLEGCESLNKLDLTLNFIGELTSVENLKENCHLRNLTLVGNPCAQYEGYRDFVVHTLPQLHDLDGKAISRSERIVAAQKYALGLRQDVLRQQAMHREFRKKQKETAVQKLEENLLKINLDDAKSEEEIRRIWSEKSDNTPEARILLSRLSLRQEELKNKKPETKEKAPKVFFAKDGRPLNINEAHLDFTMEYEDGSCLVLKLHLNRSLDTNEMSTDVHPEYVRVTIKGSIFQLHLLEEVKPDVSRAERSLSTGCLLVRMPLANEYITPLNVKQKTRETVTKKTPSKREWLEIGAEKNDMDFTRIIQYPEDSVTEFQDDPEVPPLEEL